jgi:hypothetical protein
MAIQLKHTFTIPTTIERVGQALCSESYSIEGANLREDVQSATHVVVSDEGARLEYEVRYVEYVRTKTGRIDKSRTQSGRTRTVWDREAKILRWVYTTEASERFKMEGVYRLTEQGEATHVDYQVTIDVRVPLIGNRIAKAVAKGFEDDFPRLQALLTRHACG